MRKWLYCILLTAMVLPMVSCRRAVEKARRNIRLEAVEKVERKGMGGAEAVVRVKNGTGYKLVLERAKVDLFYAGSRVMSIILHGRVEVPRRTTGSFTSLWRVRTTDPMAYYVMVKKSARTIFRRSPFRLRSRGAGAGFGKKFGRDGAVVGIFEYLWAVLAGREKLSGRVMRRLTTFIAVIFAAAAFAPLRAQSLDAFKERLAAPVVSDAAFGTARVTVTEYGDAEKAVDDASRVGQRLRLRGYRVCIFFDNGQDARAGAFAAEALFKETYPEIMVYPVYENPYFKVVVGNCLTAEEAIILKGKIASTFPKAFVKSEEFSMADLLN